MRTQILFEEEDMLKVYFLTFGKIQMFFFFDNFLLFAMTRKPRKPNILNIL